MNANDNINTDATTTTQLSRWVVTRYGSNAANQSMQNKMVLGVFLAQDADDAIRKAERAGHECYNNQRMDAELEAVEDDDEIELIDDDQAEVIADREHEYSTEQIIRIDDEVFYRHQNGGARGSHNCQDGDGVWRERPVEPARLIDRTECRRLLLDWGYGLDEIVEMTRNIR